MKKNIGLTDKVIRLALAALLLVLHFTGTVSGTLGIVFLIISIVLALTTLISFCGLYAIFGINTCRLKDKKN